MDRRVLAALAFVGLSVVGLVGFTILRQDSVTAVDADEVIEDFASAAPTEADDGPDWDPATFDRSRCTDGQRPPDGVWTYTTTGFESVTTLGGSRHDYPAVSTITVTTDADGITAHRWQPLEERFDVRWTCPSADGPVPVELGLGNHRVFFRVTTEQLLPCTPVLVDTQEPLPDDTYATDACSDADPGDPDSGTTTTIVRRDLGTEVLTIDGIEVETRHVLLDGESSGSATGPVRRERWLRADGLLVKEITSILSESDTILGATTYTEEYTLELTSLDPASG